MTRVSVIVPTYNEQKEIGECLNSLNQQTFKDLEIILVDDGSTDSTLITLKSFKNIKVLKQDHDGTAKARNLGAKYANGEILVFVDADMTFDKNFIEKIIDPIIRNKIKGTFSKEEYVKNHKNVWSKCWNINKGLPLNRMHQENYPNEQPVFRAILKREFDRVGGFESIGYIDDFTLSEKLGYKAQYSPGAIFYHTNPGSIIEVFNQARWIGKSEFKRRKIENENIMRIIALFRYSFPFSLFKGFYISLKESLPQFLFFKIIYDFAIEISLVRSFFGEHRYK